MTTSYTDDRFARAGVTEFAVWFEHHGFDINGVLDRCEGDLRSTGRYLPRTQLNLYRKVVVVGTFLVEWIKLNRNSAWHALVVAVPADVKLFELAVVMACDGESVKKQIRDLTKLRVQDTGSLSLYDTAAIDDFVVSKLDDLARSMFERCDTNRAPRVALTYLRIIAASQFLRGLLLSRTRYCDGGVLSYLEDPPAKLSDRIRLAFKLAYMPLALTPDEVTALREDYDVNIDDYRPWKVRDVAHSLEFKSAACLSRWLYKVRKWSASRARRRAARQSIQNESGHGGSDLNELF